MRLSFLALALLVCACASDPAPEAEPVAGTPSTVESSAGDTQSADDACGLLDPDDIARHIPSAENITEEDIMRAIEVSDSARSCTWLYSDGHRIDLHVDHEPEGNRFDTWASRMLATRVEDQGHTRVDGLGVEAIVAADDSEVVWRLGEDRMFVLSYGGPAPGMTTGQDALLALAREVDV